MQGIKLNAQGITATINGTKNNTRRPLKLYSIRTRDGLLIENIFKYANMGLDGNCTAFFEASNGEYLISFIEESKYKVNEVVFFQEEFYEYTDSVDGYFLLYKADAKLGTEHMLDWQASSEMTEEQSRIKIKITGIKVERLQDISKEDCIKEGISFGDAVRCVGWEKDYYNPDTLNWLKYTPAFKQYIWDKLPYKPPYDWDSNPYVFVYEFEVIK